MKKRIYVGAVTRPISLTAAIRVENPYNEKNTSQYGTLTQSIDSLSGDYYPNRQNYPTLLGLHVLLEDPNAATASSEVVWTGQNTVAWEVIRNGVVTAVTAQSVGDFTLSGQQLRVRLNQTAADGNVVARATGTFRDSVGRAQTATAEVPLTLSASTATNLVLLRDRLGTPGYVGESYRLNPLTLDTAAKLDSAQNWKRKCAVQLCDGTTPVPDAFTLNGGGDAMDEADYADTPSGSAFYFWYYRAPDNRLIQCTEDTEWLDAAWLPSGTASKEVTVDLTKIRQVRLVCRAGYIPYGQMEDYLDGDGLVRPEKLMLGFREQTFELGAELPDVERIVVADVAHCRLERTELASSSVTIVKRALVTAGGTTLNDLGETTPHASGTQSWVEKLYAIEWFVAKASGQEVSVGTGEWLQVTPAQLATLHGAALNADGMPQMSVSVEPRYPKLTGNNYVEGYQRGGDAVTPSQQQGNKGFLRQLDFFLLDTTDNTGDYTSPLRLQRNNILRFEGGGWAPVVGISAAMAADAALELWRRNGSGSYVRYCSAGDYDPEAYVEGVLRPYFRGALTGWYPEGDGGWPRLYKKDDEGNYIEAHALLPWETTETKYTVGIGYPFGVYLLDHVVGASGWEWNGIFTDVTEWDGIDLTPYYLAPTAIAPGPSGLASGSKLRNFFWLSRPSGWSGGYAGNIADGDNAFNAPGRHYPYMATATTGATGIQNMDWARANNSVARRSHPFAELGFHALNTLVTSQELLYSRRNLSDKDFFGSGISAADPCTTEQEWRHNGGLRYRRQGESSWNYAAWSEDCRLVTTYETTHNWSYALSNGKGKEQVMESQLAASFATEFSVAATTDASQPVTYTMYGARYWWMAAGGAPTLTDGWMNCRVYRTVEGQATGQVRGDTSAQESLEWQACLRMSLYGGMSLAGDVYVYAQGGAEIIYTATVAAQVGLPLSVWLVPDQLKWPTDTSTSKTMADVSGYPDTLQDSEKYAIEKSASAIRLDDGSAVILDHNWGMRRLGYSPLNLAAGGEAARGECAYNYSKLAIRATKGNRIRLGLRFRGYANSSASSPRFWNGAIAVSNSSNRNFGCSAQALIGT